MGINMFNRREIVATRDMNELNRITGCLVSNNIGYTTRTNSITNPGRSHGIPNIRADAAYETRIYVHKNDYNKAIHVRESNIQVKNVGIIHSEIINDKKQFENKLDSSDLELPATKETIVKKAANQGILFADTQKQDSLLHLAVDVVFESGIASVSTIQRRLKLGYSRAAQLMDKMEQLGIVGPFEGSKPRQILVTREQLNEIDLDTIQLEQTLIEEDTKKEIIDPINRKEEASNKPYSFPPSSLLTASHGFQESLLCNVDETKKDASGRLEAVLKSFGMNAKISNVTYGPSVTRYDVELGEGTKLSKLTNLTDDIAFSLGVDNVRIAPVPGKASIVGVGIPSQPSTVYIRDLIESTEFTSSDDPTTIVIGRGFDGQSVVSDLASLSHLLIAGSDGSGKTVFLDTLITSMLYKASPEQLRLIMIDAKMIDLKIFSDIPHLLVPVVTDRMRAKGALEWVANEKERRHNLLAQQGRRNIISYNEFISSKPNSELLPRIVIIIDHLSWLSDENKELTGVIKRIAKNASMCGIHLVISSQNPESDVIKDIVEAIKPSFVAFQIRGKHGSMVILGTDEAEKLMGRGDMLFLPVGMKTPQRVQGCYITEREIAQVVAHIK